MQSYNQTYIYELWYNGQCTLKLCPIEWAQVRYDPSLAGNALYLAIFSLFLLVQIYLGIRYKTYTYLGAMFGGLVLEIIGYVARIQMSINPFLKNPFLLYIITLTIGPVFFTAAIYFCLGHIVTLYGPHISRLKPKTYGVIFICCDIFSLVLQSIGGGIANTASTRKGSDNGVHIMVAGLAFQVFSLVIFIVLCAEFFWNVKKRKSERIAEYAYIRENTKFKLFLYSLGAATFLILVRSTFRVAELSEGFRGRLANDQVTFMILEGAMVTLAVLCLTVFHPGFAFQGTWKKTNVVRGTDVKA